MTGFGGRLPNHSSDTAAYRDQWLDAVNLYDVWATREAERIETGIDTAVETLNNYFSAIRPHVDDYLTDLGLEPLPAETDIVYNDHVDGARKRSNGDIVIGYPGEHMAEHVLHPIPLGGIIAHEAVHLSNEAYIPDTGWKGEAVDEAIAQYVTLATADDLVDAVTRTWFRQQRFKTYTDRWEDDHPHTPHPELYHAAATCISDRLAAVDGGSATAVQWVLDNRDDLVDAFMAMDVEQYPE